MSSLFIWLTWSLFIIRRNYQYCLDISTKTRYSMIKDEWRWPLKNLTSEVDQKKLIHLNLESHKPLWVYKFSISYRICEYNQVVDIFYRFSEDRVTNVMPNQNKIIFEHNIFLLILCPSFIHISFDNIPTDFWDQTFLLSLLIQLYERTRSLFFSLPTESKIVGV